MSELKAISPLDGRYAAKTEPLAHIVSEYGLMRYRLQVEIAWLKALSAIPGAPLFPALNEQQSQALDTILDNFDDTAANRIKTIEATTNHDVKAIEYYLKEALTQDASLAHLEEFIHFACTSEDINNVSYALMMQAAQEVLLPFQQAIVDTLRDMAHEHASLPMLSRTHGQSASPTTLGKECANIVCRLEKALGHIGTIEQEAKINGAVGNFNAHHTALPEVDWLAVSHQFIEGLSLEWNPYTTQIEPHDTLCQYFDAIKRFNVILIDASRDIWGYISLGYFKQKLKEGEVGSSTMPHKVNPIDFENAEGNLGLSNALAVFFSDKLPISRWQRDLTDSTTLRNTGCCLAYALIAYQAFSKGLSKLSVNAERLADDLKNNPEVLGEALQTVMRRHGIEKPYEKLKALTRGKKLTLAEIHTFVDTLELPDSEKAALKQLTPETYVGLAEQLAGNI